MMITKMNNPKLLPLLLLTPILLVSCNSTYPSRKQASLACKEWMDNGRDIEITYVEVETYWERNKDYKPSERKNGRYVATTSTVDKTKTRWNRACLEEKETS